MSQVENNKEFQLLIGGIIVTPKEKEKNLNKIQEAIIKNNQGKETIKISNETFAKSYPESLELVKEYYDSLYHAQVSQLRGWDGVIYIDRQKKATFYQTCIKREMLETLIIFVPELIDKEIIEIKNKFNISANEVSSVFNKYKKIIEHVTTIKELGEKQEKYHIAKTIYEEIVINGMTKTKFSQEYKISISSMNKHIELLKEIDERLYQEVKNTIEKNNEKRFLVLKELILKIGAYYKDKIKVNTQKGVVEMPFTILDYYSMTNYSPDTMLNFINKSIEFISSIKTKEEEIYKNRAKIFLRDHKNIGGIASKEYILKKHMAAGTRDNIVQMNEEICDEIFDLFEKEKIPKNKALIEQAFYRYALGKPILPLKQLETTRVLKEEELEPKTTKTLKP